MTSLWYEILSVTLGSDQVVWLRRREDGEAHLWRITHQAGLHPTELTFLNLRGHDIFFEQIVNFLAP